jgi:phosphoribosylamine--glycine ligase
VQREEESLMQPRRMLVLGAGAREHAIARRLAQDPVPTEVLVAPGNPGIATAFPCVPLDPVDPAAVLAAVREHAIDLVVVGPEAPLAAGVVDALAAAGVEAFGPTREAARLETSKWFAKTVLAEAGAPTARAVRAGSVAEAAAALDGFPAPWVLKADGLAAGKGVLVTADREAAREFLEACFSGDAFGASGSVVVVEEFLAGDEASLFAVTDGERFVLLPAARDFKRALDGDRGLNTGGMGARAPHAGVDATLEREVGEQVVAPVLRAMRARGTPYRGVLYVGLMLTAAGPKVIEFNARFGDPETQAVLPLLGGDFGALLAGAAREALDPGAVRREPGAAVAVVIADEKYPERPSGEARVTGLEAATRRAGVHACFAGVTRDGEAWKITGGRALSIVATGRDAREAAQQARDAVADLGGRGWRRRFDVAGTPGGGGTGVSNSTSGARPAVTAAAGGRG